jgi:hypothetical protein
MEKTCPRCKNVLPATAFYCNRASYDKLGTYCKKCSKEYYKTVQHKYYSRTATPRALYSKRHRETLQQDIISHYGGKCACCGETTTAFLTIDHIKDDGAKHKREVGRSSVYSWLKKNNFPEGFRVLCWNCNCGRWRNGGICPHAARKEGGGCGG